MEIPHPPLYPRDDYVIGCRHRDQGRYHDAYVCFQKVLPSHKEYANAQFEVGCFKHIRKEPSYENFKKAAKLGHLESQIYIGEAHLSKKWEKYLEMAATKSAYAAMYLAEYNFQVIEKTKHAVARYDPEIHYWEERDKHKGIKYLRLAYELQSPRSYYKYYRLTDDIQWLKIAANAGHAKALYELGLKEGNAVQALKYFEEAAERGDIEALKWLEEHKPGNYRTHRLHIKAFSKRYQVSYLDEHLALRGDPEALMKMAGYFWLGIDRKRDHRKALDYIDKLERNNPAQAIKFRSYCHWKGEGLPRDLELAKNELHEEEKA